MCVYTNNMDTLHNTRWGSFILTAYNNTLNKSLFTGLLNDTETTVAYLLVMKR